MPAGSSPFAGRSIPDPGFDGDDGRASQALVDALASYSAERGDPWEVLRILARSRLLVPVVAVGEQTTIGDDGLRVDKQSTMATVLIENPDGRRSMVAFTGVEALRAWRPAARPVPVSAINAAKAAVQEGAAALLVDVAGPVPFAVAGTELLSLADARVLARAADRGAGARLRSTLARCLEGEPAVLDARLESTRGRLQLAVVVDPALRPDAYQQLRHRLVGRVGGLTQLTDEFPAGVHLRIVAPGAEMGDTPSLVRQAGPKFRDDPLHDRQPDPKARR